MAAQAPRYANRSPGPGVARRTFLPGTGAGVAVRIAVGALADHAGSRVIRVRGPPPDMNSAPAMSPAIPPVSMSGAAPRSQKES